MTTAVEDIVDRAAAAQQDDAPPWEPVEERARPRRRRREVRAPQAPGEAAATRPARDYGELVAVDGRYTDERPPATSWGELDLGPVVHALVAGTAERPEPTIGVRSDGRGLFYAGRVNALIGASGDGKSWLALLTAAQELRAGHHVVMVDLEDSATGIAGRLLDLGVAPADIVERFHYVWPDEPFGLEAAVRIEELVLRTDAVLVIIDSAGEAMALNRVNPNADDEVARWFRVLPRRIARLGPCVLTLDHVVKDREARGLFAIGSQRKRAAVTGAAYLLEASSEFGREQRGAAHLTTAKDRLGNYVRGRRAAEFVLDARSQPYDATLDAPAPAGSSGDPFRPTTVMEKISRYVEINPGLGRNAIRTAVGGTAKYVTLAVDLLVSEGFIEVERGPNRSMLHKSIRPFRTSPEASEEEDS